MKSKTSVVDPDPALIPGETNTKPKKKQRQWKWKKPKDKPKRPLSAYNLFFQHERKKMTAQKVGFAAMGQSIGSKWKSLDKASRRCFEEQAEKEKALYSKKLEEWRSTQTHQEQGRSLKQPEGLGMREDVVEEDDDEESCAVGSQRQGSSENISIATSDETCFSTSRGQTFGTDSNKFARNQGLEEREQENVTTVDRSRTTDSNLSFLQGGTLDSLVKQKELTTLLRAGALPYRPVTNFDIRAFAAARTAANMRQMQQQAERDLIMLQLLGGQVQPSTDIFNGEKVNIKPRANTNQHNTTNEDENVHQTATEHTNAGLNPADLQAFRGTVTSGFGGTPFDWVSRELLASSQQATAKIRAGQALATPIETRFAQTTHDGRSSDSVTNGVAQMTSTNPLDLDELRKAAALSNILLRNKAFL